MSERPALTPDQREWLRSEVLRRSRMVECLGCGEAIERTSERRRYCSRACANRDWHVRRRIVDPEYTHTR